MEPTQQAEPTNEYNQPQVVPKRSSSRKKISAIIVLVVVLVLVAAAVVISRTNASKTADETLQSTVVVGNPVLVNITAKGFEPASISVKPGQVVQWTNKDIANHQIASDPHPSDDALAGLNDDTVLQPTDVFSYTFEDAGIYTYHDELNPLEIKGTIIVE